jgi:hypothetical protein
MKQALVLAPSALRPTTGDFFLLLGGTGLSQWTAHLGTLVVEPRPDATDLVRRIVPALPGLLRLPEGILLLWPLFLLSQRLRGRTHGLSSGEWLWVFAWLGTAVLLALTAWYEWGTVPPFLQERSHWLAIAQRAWYLIFLSAMAIIAVLLGLLDRIFRWQQPWTHHLSLALAIWPALPLAGILTLAGLDSPSR